LILKISWPFNILSEEETEEYAHGHISEDFIKKHAISLNSNFYLCGPPPMVEEMEKQLDILKVDKKKIVTEEY